MRNQTFHRLFFAITPDTVTARRTHAFVEPFAQGAALLPPDRLHVTMAITNDYSIFPDQAAETLCAIGDGVTADPFALSLDRLVASRSSVALRPGLKVPALSTLAERLGKAMRSAGLYRDDYRFSAHQTAFYRKGEPWQRPINGFEWDVRDFVLIHSEVGRSRHTVLKRWPLVAQPRLL